MKLECGCMLCLIKSLMLFVIGVVILFILELFRILLQVVLPVYFPFKILYLFISHELIS
jgi:hypothetical protein